MVKSILIVGASARAAAMSARRAGLQVSAADLFADRDLRACCSAVQVANYPGDFRQVVEQSDADAWMYTGGLENHAGLIARMSQTKPLLGSAAAALRQVRDPWRVAAALSRAGFPHPSVARSPEDAADGLWMSKPLRSCGGRDVRLMQVHRGEATPVAAHARGPASLMGQHRGSFPSVYWQQFITGVPGSAVFVAGWGKAWLLGATQQLVGAEWLGASGFQYCGSIGPWTFGEAARIRLEALGDCLAAAFPLRGLFGVDFIASGSAGNAEEPQFLPIEVNPRYPASLEVLERATGIHAIAHHVAACVGGPRPTLTPSASSTWGKAIIYARQRFVVDCFPMPTTETDDDTSTLADIPHAGTTIDRGHPVVTLFACGENLSEVMASLRDRAAAVHEWIACVVDG